MGLRVGARGGLVGEKLKVDEGDLLFPVQSIPCYIPFMISNETLEEHGRTPIK